MTDPTPTRPSLATLLLVIGVASLALLAGLATLLLVATDGRCKLKDLGVIMAFLGPTTLLLSVGLVLRTVRRATPAVDGSKPVGGRFLGHGAVAGMLNGVLCVVVVALFAPVFDPVIIIGMVIAGIMGAPFGFLFSLFYLPVVRSFLRWRLQPYWDGRHWFRTTLGLWAMVAAGGWGLLIGLVHRPHPYATEATRPLAWLLLGLALLGGAGAIWGGLGRWRRSRWLSRVRQGSEAGWCIVDVVGQEDLPAAGPGPHTSVLARRVSSNAGAAYREQELVVPMARVR